MATVNKNFRVKNGLNVAGTATFDSNVVLGTTPISFDTQTGRLQIQINGTWTPVAFTGDIPDYNALISWQDIGLAIDYNGQPVYTVQANGVNTTATKFADNGGPSTTEFYLTFDPGYITA
jgi:hypothetical protein